MLECRGWNVEVGKRWQDGKFMMRESEREYLDILIIFLIMINILPLHLFV